MTFVWLLTALPGSWGAAHGVLAVPHRLRRLWDCGTGNWQNPTFPKQKPSKKTEQEVKKQRLQPRPFYFANSPSRLADTWWPSTFVVELRSGDPNPGGERESSSLLLPLVCQGPKRPGTRMRKTPTGLNWSVFCDSAWITDLLVTAKVCPRLNGVQINTHLNNTYALAKEK